VTTPDDDDVAVQPAFDELGRLSFAEHSLDSLLERVTAVAGRVLPGDPITSVTVLTHGRPTTAAASGDLALELDQLQYRLGDGPCVTAASTGRATEIPDTAHPTQWVEVARRAAEEGCGSVLSFPLPVREELTAALNVYARRFTVADERTRRLMSRFVSYAVVPVSNMYLYTTAVERAGNLQTALDSRGVIDQAKGILMERYRLTADQAFQALTRVSMETNTKVRDVAERLVSTGEFAPG